MDLERYRLYRNTQLWPLADELNYEQWLSNFADGEEQLIAQHILDFFIYFPDGLINQMMSTVIGKCGYYFKQQRGSWSDADFKSNCWYSFIPGEDQKPTDSGHLFTRKLRDVLHIPEDRIISFTDLLNQLNKTKNQNVVLVDDFVGSGHQTWVAWVFPDSTIGKSFQNITIDNNHKVVYAPLIVNHKGYDKIRNDCSDLELKYVHMLTKQYSIFEQDCPCWNGDVNLFKKAVLLLENKSKALGIPFTNGAHVNDVKGYGEQGLAIAFAHGIPDACPPIFYWETEEWKPLMKKVYPRK